MRYWLFGYFRKLFLGRGCIASSLKLKNCQESSFSIAGFTAEILRWKIGTEQNKATLKQHKMKHLMRICRLGLRMAVYGLWKRSWGQPGRKQEAARPHHHFMAINCFLSLKSKHCSSFHLFSSLGDRHDSRGVPQPRGFANRFGSVGPGHGSFWSQSLRNGYSVPLSLLCTFFLP